MIRPNYSIVRGATAEEDREVRDGVVVACDGCKASFGHRFDFQWEAERWIQGVPVDEASRGSDVRDTFLIVAGRLYCSWCVEQLIQQSKTNITNATLIQTFTETENASDDRRQVQQMQCPHRLGGRSHESTRLPPMWASSAPS